MAFAERRLFSAIKIPREQVRMVEAVVGYFQNYLDSGICTALALDKLIIDGWSQCEWANTYLETVCASRWLSRRS